MDLDLAGHEGTIRAAYHTAARIGPWRIETIGPTLYRVECHVVHRNAAWLAYRPLQVRLRLMGGSWLAFEMASDAFEFVDDDGLVTAKFFVSGDPVPVQGG